MLYASTEEEDILQRSTKRSKEEGGNTRPAHGSGGSPKVKGRVRKSYKESVIGGSRTGPIDMEGEDNEGDVSDDDVVEEATEDDTWFGVGMSKEEKIAARRPWRNSLIIKLVGRSIGYH